jgi:hypothetical protein
VKVDAAAATMMGISMSRQFLGDSDATKQFPNPALQPSSYCRLETFKAGEKEVVSLAWQGAHREARAARFAFMVPNSGTFFQIESLFGPEEVAPSLAALGIVRPVQLVHSNDRMAAVIHAFTDWPSYDEAKRLVIAALATMPPPIVTVASPAESINVTVNQSVLVERPPSQP